MPNKKENKKSNYTAKDIYVLKGLEPVRQRPGMYIGSTGSEGLHHLVWEVLCNSIDEAIMGYCSEITLKLLPNQRIEISDNGRGIPVDKHSETKKSALETILTTLHAGGKFGGKVYDSTGGLHGIGVSAVCALSDYLRAEICRDGKKHSQEYSRGVPTTKLKDEGNCKTSGTTIIFEPDMGIFKKSTFSYKKILNYIRQQAYLTKGIKINYLDLREEGKEKSYAFYFEGGIVSYVKYLSQGSESRQQKTFYTSGKSRDILVEAAFLYTKEIEKYEEGFANNVCTPEGGTHLTGLRSALTRVLNDYARKEEMIKSKDENLTGDDIREGLTAVVSVKISNPQFEGQTKAKLGNPEAKTAVENVISEGLKDFLERNPKDAKAIIDTCILSSEARKAAKAARQTVLRKGALKGLTLPGKLADCLSRKPEESELYIVEGDSAGGSSRQGRDRHFQAILPIKGKILNVEKARLDKILASKEVKSLIIALGTAIAEDFDLSKLRYHKVIIMTDADVDGSHIRTLLLTLFYRYFKPIIEAGYLYIAQPPLYRIKIGSKIDYVFNEKSREEFLKSHKNQKNISTQRYKGLGEMNPDQLWETTMNPETRLLLQVKTEDAKEADNIFDILMGEEVLPRRKFIQTHAKAAKNLDV